MRNYINALQKRKMNIINFSNKSLKKTIESYDGDSYKYSEKEFYGLIHPNGLNPFFKEILSFINKNSDTEIFKQQFLKLAGNNILPTVLMTYPKLAEFTFNNIGDKYKTNEYFYNALLAGFICNNSRIVDTIVMDEKFKWSNMTNLISESKEIFVMGYFCYVISQNNKYHIKSLDENIKSFKLNLSLERGHKEIDVLSDNKLFNFIVEYVMKKGKSEYINNIDKVFNLQLDVTVKQDFLEKNNIRCANYPLLAKIIPDYIYSGWEVDKKFFIGDIMPNVPEFINTEIPTELYFIITKNILYLNEDLNDYTNEEMKKIMEVILDKKYENIDIKTIKIELKDNSNEFDDIDIDFSDSYEEYSFKGFSSINLNGFNKKISDMKNIDFLGKENVKAFLKLMSVKHNAVLEMNGILDNIFEPEISKYFYSLINEGIKINFVSKIYKIDNIYDPFDEFHQTGAIEFYLKSLKTKDQNFAEEYIYYMYYNSKENFIKSFEYEIEDYIKCMNEQLCHKNSSLLYEKIAETYNIFCKKYEGLLSQEKLIKILIECTPLFKREINLVVEFLENTNISKEYAGSVLWKIHSENEHSEILPAISLLDKNIISNNLREQEPVTCQNIIKSSTKRRL